MNLYGRLGVPKTRGLKSQYAVLKARSGSTEPNSNASLAGQEGRPAYPRTRPGVQRGKEIGRRGFVWFGSLGGLYFEGEKVRERGEGGVPSAASESLPSGKNHFLGFKRRGDTKTTA